MKPRKWKVTNLEVVKLERSTSWGQSVMLVIDGIGVGSQQEQ